MSAAIDCFARRLALYQSTTIGIDRNHENGRDHEVKIPLDHGEVAEVVTAQKKDRDPRLLPTQLNCQNRP